MAGLCSRGTGGACTGKDWQGPIPLSCASRALRFAALSACASPRFGTYEETASRSATGGLFPPLRGEGEINARLRCCFDSPSRISRLSTQFQEIRRARGGVGQLPAGISLRIDVICDTRV